MHTEWRCDQDGSVLPLHVAEHISAPIVESVRAKVLAGTPRPLPLWCPWPSPAGWTMTGVGWVGDDRSGVRGTIVACSGPCPVEGGPADIVIIAEEPGVGLGPRFAGIAGPDPGPFMEPLPGAGPDSLGGSPDRSVASGAGSDVAGVGGTASAAGASATPGAFGTVGQAKVHADGWPTPLWLVKSPADRCAYAGEARGLWLYMVSRPAAAGYLLDEDLTLHDLAESLPSQLVYGAPSPFLHSVG
jgi:hypothetical protein